MSLLWKAKQLRERLLKVKRELTGTEHLALSLAEELIAANIGPLECQAFYKPKSDVVYDVVQTGEPSTHYVLIKSHALVAMRGEKLNIDAGLTGQVFFEPIALDEQSRTESEEGG